MKVSKASDAKKHQKRRMALLSFKSASQNTNFSYTDLHCHILPGLDDGARDWHESLEMAKNAVNSGAHRVIATPHVLRGPFRISPEEIKAKVAELRSRLHDAGIPLEVIPGSEVYLAAGAAREYRAGRLQPIGESGYLLVELPTHYLPDYIFREFYQLQSAGAGVVLAHPERNTELCRRKNVIRDLCDSGVLLQVNAGSFLEVFGRRAKACADYLLRKGLMHFVGSDAHSGLPPDVSAVGADISAALQRISKSRPYGFTFFAKAERRVSNLLSGKL